MVCYGTISQSAQRGINQHMWMQKGNTGPCIEKERGTVLSCRGRFSRYCGENSTCKRIKEKEEDGGREVRGSVITCFFLPS